MSLVKTKHNANLARLQNYVKGCIAIGALFWAMGFAVVIAATKTHYSVVGCSLIFVGFSICIGLFSGFNEKFKVLLILPVILSGFLLGAIASVTGVGPFEYINKQPVLSAFILSSAMVIGHIFGKTVNRLAGKMLEDDLRLEVLKRIPESS